MAMPFERARAIKMSKGVLIYDGNRFLFKILLADHKNYQEVERIADEVVGLMRQHGANDDTGQIYDDWDNYDT